MNEGEIYQFKKHGEAGFKAGLGLGFIFCLLSFILGYIICYQYSPSRGTQYATCWNLDQAKESYVFTLAYCPDLKHSHKLESLSNTWTTLKIRSKSMYEQIKVEEKNWYFANMDCIFWNENRKLPPNKEKAVLNK